MFITKTKDISAYESLVILQEKQTIIEKNKVRGYHQYRKTDMDNILIGTIEDYIYDNSRVIQEAEANGILIEKSQQFVIRADELSLLKYLKTNDINLGKLTESVANLSGKYEDLYSNIYARNCDLDTYEGLMYNSYINVCASATNDFVNHMCFESSYIMDRLNEMNIVTEAEEADDNKTEKATEDKKDAKPNTPGAVTKAANNVSFALKEFLNKLKNMFKDKLDKIRTRDLKWLQSNKDKLSKIKLKGIEVSIYDNWNVKTDDMVNRQTQVSNIIERFDITKPYSDLEKQLETYKDTQGNLKKGLLNFYNTGKAKEEAKAVTIRDERLAPVVVSMVNYCLSFNEISNKISGQIRKCEAHVSRVSRDAKARGVKENYCLVEDDLFINTDLALCENFHLLLEAETKPKVGVVKRDETQQQTDKMDDTSLSGYSKIVKQNQLALTTLLTALETKYFENIKVLKALLKEGK